MGASKTPLTWAEADEQVRCLLNSLMRIQKKRSLRRAELVKLASMVLMQLMTSENDSIRERALVRLLRLNGLEGLVERSSSPRKRKDEDEEESDVGVSGDAVNELFNTVAKLKEDQ